MKYSINDLRLLGYYFKMWTKTSEEKMWFFNPKGEPTFTYNEDIHWDYEAKIFTKMSDGDYCYVGHEKG